MIIAKLMGGLGNQMYQFASGKVLARKLDTKLILDLSWFDSIKGNPGVVQRVYELDGFGIKPITASATDRLSLKLNPAKKFVETGVSYNKAFEELSGNVILEGYWQSYKYFSGYEEFVKGLYIFPESRGENKELLNKINSTESVSLHVRRGDYNTKASRAYHGLMPTSYYEKALKHIESRVSGLHIFVFSDEIDWCKKNLNFQFPTTFVDSNSSNAGPQDMKLMSACKHNIIANSSFSWWAAWLNRNFNKMVYAPKNWFTGENHKIADRIPEDWIIL